METKTKIIICTVALIASFGTGYFSKPSKVVTKTVEKEVIKEVVKIVKEVKTNVVTVVKEVKAPDGTITTETTTHDTTQVVENTQSDTEKKKETKNNTTITNDIGLSVQALALAKLNDLNNLEYGILIKKRIISNISATALGTNKGTVGLAVGIDF